MIRQDGTVTIETPNEWPRLHVYNQWVATCNRCGRILTHYGVKRQGFLDFIHGMGWTTNCCPECASFVRSEVAKANAHKLHAKKKKKRVTE